MLKNDHSLIHSCRVALYASILCKQLKVSKKDTVMILIACILHDLGRKNNCNDTKHGDNINFIEYGIEVNEIIKNLISLHCKTDSKSKQFNRKDLLFILKDSDALDRLRTNDLDEKYLRFNETKKLLNLAMEIINVTFSL